VGKLQIMNSWRNMKLSIKWSYLRCWLTCVSGVFILANQTRLRPCPSDKGKS
jgi:hypothetical protein